MGNTGSKEDENRELMILKHAVENTNEAFVTIDKNHRVLFFNKAAEKVFGYGREEIIGDDLNPAVSAQKPPKGRSFVIRVPIVLTIRQPPIAVPRAMAVCAISTIHIWM